MKISNSTIEDLQKLEQREIINEETDGWKATIEEVRPNSAKPQSLSIDACYWAISDICVKLRSIETTLRTVQRLLTSAK